MRIGEKNESVSLRKQMNAKNKAVSNRWIGNKFIKMTIHENEKKNLQWHNKERPKQT